MPVLSFLTDAANSAVLSITERSSITTSIIIPQSRMALHFDNGIIVQHFRSGSSARDTILPRSMDEQSDIDYMVILSDGSATPQTYLNRSETLVKRQYGSPEIYQSSPTIVLELNHIKLDLVPATETWPGEPQIPSGSDDWMTTNPNDFDVILETRSKDSNSLIKPIIRLMRYWDATSGFPLDSLAMEKWIRGQGFWFQSNQKGYLFSVIDNLSTDSSYSQRVNNEIMRAKTIMAKVGQCEKDQTSVTAENEVKKLLGL